MKSGASDNRVYADLAGLIALEREAGEVDLRPHHAVKSLLYGRYRSRVRGRGLDLEEVKQYNPGDDIRLMDWKATIRTGKPHVRTYTEERDRPALLLVDQRISMFFGSRDKMKSVVAAEMAALCAWRVISAGDRVGGLIFNDDSIFEIMPRRHPAGVLRMLQTIADYNHRLRAGEGARQNDGQFNKILSKAERLCTHDYLVILVSDLTGWNPASVKHLKTIARHNDAVVFYVFDPLEKQLPPRGRYVVSDGRLQIEFDAAEKDVGERFSRDFSNRVDTLTVRLKKHDVPVNLVDTIHPPQRQLRRAMGEWKGRR